MLPRIDFTTTLSGVYYKLLHCNTLEMEVFKSSAAKAVCDHCQEISQSRICETCKTTSVDTISKGDHNIIMRFMKYLF